MPKNLLVNVLSFVTNILIGLWLLPYLINKIGVVAYGLIPLAMFFTEYIGIIISALNNAIGRFLLIALHKKDYLRVNETFNTSLVIMLILGLIQALFMFIVILDFNYFIQVPPELKEDAIWLFSLTFLSFIVSLFRSVFATTIYAFNRTDIIQLIRIFQILFRVILIVVLFNIFNPSLKYIGIANFISSFISFLITGYFSKKITPQLKINFFLFRIRDVKQMTTMGLWVLIQQVGAILFLKLDLYLINNLLGSYKAGEYSIIIKLNNIIRAMIGVFAGVISPVIMIYYAQKKFAKVVAISQISIKMLGVFLAIPIGILSALSTEVLRLWVGDEFTHLNKILILSLTPLIINLAILPLFTITTAYNKVKIPGIITILFGVLNLLFVIFIIKYTNLEVFGVLLVGAILLTLKNVLFTPLYTAYIMKINIFSFIKPLKIGVISFIFSYLEMLFIRKKIEIDSLIQLVIILIIFSTINLFIIIFFLPKRDKQLIKMILPEKINKLIFK